jgi:uncharacterized delta-60 repeat protein
MIQPDNKILLGGTTQGVFKLARLNSDGTLDTDGSGAGGFASTTIGTNSNINALALQPDGKIIAPGRSSNGANDDVAVVRYTSTGVPDTTFDGAFRNITVVRYNPNGSFDPTFGNGGIVTTSLGSTASHADAVLIQPDGKILVGLNLNSFATNSDFAVLRYNPDGSLDSPFGANRGSTLNFSFPSSSFNNASDTQNSSSRAVFLIRQTRGLSTDASDENNPTSIASLSEASASGNCPSRVFIKPGSVAVNKLT